MNCKTYGRDCVYQPLSDADRAEERRRRQSKPSHVSPTVDDASPAPRADDEAHSDVRFPAETSPPHAELVAEGEKTTNSMRTGQPGVSRIVVSANGVPSYHGRTSALFEENIQDRPFDIQPRMPDE